MFLKILVRVLAAICAVYGVSDEVSSFASICGCLSGKL
jgi:hypothetical protein